MNRNKFISYVFSSNWFLLFGVLTFVNCSTYKNGVNHKTNKASRLLVKLKRNNHRGIMVGHQDDLAYGIGWKYNGEKKLNSDVLKATDQYPAVIGWDIGKVGDSLNLDGVSFQHMRQLIIDGHKKGIINTLSWHAFMFKDSISSWDKISGFTKTLLPKGKNHQEFVSRLDKVADFILSLKTSKGKQIPVMFRPWHEMDGTWFWWGKTYRTAEEYKQLFRFTIDYLKEQRNVKNILVTYSPDRHFYSEEEYLIYYPGDNYVDILGTDNYYDFTKNGDGLDAIVNKLNIVTNLAQKKGKLAAFTETGSDKIKDEFWFTQKLAKVLESNNLTQKLSYVLFWRNRDKEHFYVPYKEHKAFQDFINFTKKNKVLLLKK